MYVKIVKGSYAGRKAEVLAEGTFDVFGRKITGIKVDAGLAGPLVLKPGDYVETEPPEPADPRFVTLIIEN